MPAFSLSRPLAVSLPSRSQLEVLAVALTSVGHLTWETLELARGPFVLTVIASWSLYIGWRALTEADSLRNWGLRLDNLREASWGPAVVLGVAAAGMGAWAVRTGHSPASSIWLALLAYPVWGLIQQFLLQGLVTRNLAAMPGVRPVTVVTVSAGLFSLVHFPDPVLMGGTLLLGLALAPLYLRHRNILPLGLCHGWAGTCLFYFVKQVDPLAGYFVA